MGRSMPFPPVGAATAILGIVLSEEQMELHAVDERGCVVLQGWFPLASGLDVLCSGRPGVLAIEAGAMPQSVVDTLRRAGYAIEQVAAEALAGQPARPSAAELVAGVRAGATLRAAAVMAEAGEGRPELSLF